MRREELLLDNNDRGKEEVPSSSDRSKTVISKEKDQTEYAMVGRQMADGKAEKITEDIVDVDNNNSGNGNLRIRSIETKKKTQRQAR